MTDLILKGTLNLAGTLNLVASNGGKVKIDAREVLVEGATGTGVPVILPPPPAAPIDTGTDVNINQSFNQSVTVGPVKKPVVALGICLQGQTPTWPGMVLPSVNNSTVFINGVRVNVEDDTGVTLPNGGTITFGQKSGPGKSSGQS
ncbi:hypothetical protein [Cyanobium sp. La Preciosa 7G6]|nr:hypothetical protein [Cyanobium sp. La Preciosa 7G6]MCP9835699.1 hypothetical protein [Cyanobium sp. La Preciosa 7G6]MCP9938476.1 hypothetical protein [Cyanobium sp. Aljojuca 7A6]